MCACGKNIFWLLCGGKYRFLLRSAWIVLFITTLIDISAIIAYWQLAPKSLDSKPGLGLSLLLLIAVLFLYFFAVLLSCFILIKLSPKKRESSTESTILNRNRFRNAPLLSFQPFPPSSVTYSGRLQQVLPNNAPPTLPSRNTSLSNSQMRTTFSELQGARSIAEHATGSRVGIRSFCRNKTPNLNDGKGNRQSNQYLNEMAQVSNLPKIVITEPNDASAPIYENIHSQSSQFSTKIQNNLFCNEPHTIECQNSRPKSSQSFSSSTTQCSAQRSNSIVFLHQNKADASSNHNSKIRPVSSELKNDINKSISYGYCEGEGSMGPQSIDTSLRVKPIFSKSESFVNRLQTNKVYDKQTLGIPFNQANANSRISNENYAAKPFSSKDGLCVGRFDANQSSAGDKQTLEMSLLRTKSDSRTYRDRETKEASTGPESSKQFRTQFCKITRSTDSFIAKSQPMVDQFKRYTVDKLPSTSSHKTQLLFDAVSKSDRLFQESLNTHTDKDASNVDDTLNSVLVLV